MNFETSNSNMSLLNIGKPEKELIKKNLILLILSLPPIQFLVYLIKGPIMSLILLL